MLIFLALLIDNSISIFEDQALACCFQKSKDFGHIDPARVGRSGHPQ
jgi:hypothetical protein